MRFDLLVHSQAPPYSFENESNLSSAELYRRVMKKYTKLEQLPETNYRASALRFMHVWRRIPSDFHHFPCVFSIRARRLLVSPLHRLRRGLLRLRLERRLCRGTLPSHAAQRVGAVEPRGGPEVAAGGAGALRDAAGA